LVVSHLSPHPPLPTATMALISFVLSLHRFHHICNITLHCVLAVVDVGVAIGVVDDDDAGIGVFDDDDDVLLIMMCLSRSAQRDDWSVT
jgi:hypothetical protein